MGDFIKTLFGGSTQKQQSTASSTPIDMTAPEFQNLRKQFADTLSATLSSGGGPEYTGPLNAPIGANEQTLLDQLMRQTGPNTQRQGVINDTLAGKYLPGQPGANPFLDAAIRAAQRPTLEGLTETLDRTLPGRFTQAGQFVQPQGTSAFDRAAAIASRGAANALADIATNMSYAGYESERGRQQEAIPLDRAEVDSTISNLNAQALPRLIQEMGIERGLQEFQRRSSQLLDLLKVLGGVTDETIANNQQSQSTAEGESYKGIFQPIKIF